MKELNDIERKKIRALIEIPIPEYVKEYNDDKVDLMDCYEVGFVFAHDLLRNKKIDPNLSPWGDGRSVIFEPYYYQLLQNIMKYNLSEEINDYCQLFLSALEVFENHFIK